MKRKLLVFLFFVTALSAAYAQRLPVIAVLAFESANRAVAEEAVFVTREIITEFNSWGLNVIQYEEGADYIIRGNVSRIGNNVVLTAETVEARSGRVLTETREQAASLPAISIHDFCARIIEGVPFPNFLVGTWQSVINMPDGPIVSIIEFRANRTIRVERYDTWEHRLNNSLRYEGYGTGTYTYAGFFVPRTMNLGGQSAQIDAMININLTLQDTLPGQANVNRNRLGIVFNSDRTAFEIIGGYLPSGRNYDGPSIFPSAVIGFTSFTRIR
jgi:TolB-like protein